MMPIFKLGREKRIALLSDGTETSIDEDSVLTKLQLIVGRGELGFTRQLQVFSREIVGVRLRLRHPRGPEGISAPSHNGYSDELHVPEGSIVSRLGFGNEAALNIWYREIEAPGNFVLGREKKGMWTREPADNGGGDEAHWDGHTITGFRWQKDAAPPKGGQATLHLWYREVP
jgi:hypothetical protein